MSDACDCCGGKGWLHWNEPFEIQRCDACGKAESDDAARLLHRADHPGCQWPEHDLVHAFQRQLGYVQEVGLPKQAALLLENIIESVDRETIPKMATSVFSAMGCLVNLLADPSNAAKVEWRHLEHALSFLSQIYFLAVSSGLPITAGQEDGELNEHGHWRLKEKPHDGANPQRSKGNPRAPA